MIDPKVHYSHYKPKKSVAFFVTACLTADDGRQTADDGRQTADGGRSPMQRLIRSCLL